MSHDLTIDQLKEVMPKTVRNNIDQSLVDTLNTLIQEPEMREIYRDNIIGYASIMKDGRFKLENYLDAVRYISFKLLGGSNKDAYIKAFPDRYADHLARGTKAKDIASYISAYNKNKLVNLIREQAQVPTHILNCDLFQLAINTQVSIMIDEDVSPKVRSDAANSLMTQLKPPEAKKLEIEITQKSNSAIGDLRDATMKLVKQQQDQISSGQQNAKQIAHSQIIIEDGIVVDDEDDADALFS